MPIHRWLSPAGAEKSALPSDVGDQFLWDLLAARPDLVLVTGDKPLAQDEAMQARIISMNKLASQMCMLFVDKPLVAGLNTSARAALTCAMGKPKIISKSLDS